MLIGLGQGEGAPHEGNILMRKEVLIYMTGHVGGRGELGAAAQVDSPEQDHPPLFIDELHSLWSYHYSHSPIISLALKFHTGGRNTCNPAARERAFKKLSQNRICAHFSGNSLQAGATRTPQPPRWIERRKIADCSFATAALN